MSLVYSSSQLVDCDEKKLVIKSCFKALYKWTTIIGFCVVTSDILFGANLPFYLIDRFLLIPNTLNSAKLHCSRSQGEISCSVSGKNMFGNIEKAINSNGKGSIKVTRIKIDIRSVKDHIDGKLFRDDLLLIQTQDEKITLYTSPDSLDQQEYKLNNFFQDKSQPEINIETHELSDINFNKDTVSFSIKLYIALFSILLFMVLRKLNTKKYIFNKEELKLTVLRSYNNKILLEIAFEKIRKVNILVNNSSENTVFYKIYILGKSDSKIISIGKIDIFGINLKESYNIAESICSFLLLETYQISSDIETFESIDFSENILIIQGNQHISSIAIKWILIFHLYLFLLNSLHFISSFNKSFSSFLFFVIYILIILAIIIIEKTTEEIYVVNKETQKLNIFIFGGKLLVLEIPIDKIRMVYLKKMNYNATQSFHLESSLKYRQNCSVNIFDESNSLLKTIHYGDSRIAHKVANSICSGTGQ